MESGKTGPDIVGKSLEKPLQMTELAIDVSRVLISIAEPAKKIGWVAGFYCILTAPGKQHSQLG